MTQPPTKKIKTEQTDLVMERIKADLPWSFDRDFFRRNNTSGATDFVFYCNLMEEVRSVLHKEQVKMFGKIYVTPRTTAMLYDPRHHGNVTAGYKWGGKVHFYDGAMGDHVKWLRDLVAMAIPGFTPNAVVINYYENGRNNIGWHADDEEELTDSTVASLSFGTERRFLIRSKRSKVKIAEYKLGNGSLFVMKSDCQDLYEHCVPKEARINTGRLNLTFRQMKLN